MVLSEWRRSWRVCWVPLLSDDELLTLVRLLADDDLRLIQDSTVDGECWSDGPPERACAIGCAIWLTQTAPVTAADVADEFERRLKDAREHYRGSGVTPYAFLHWWDTQPRDVVRAGLLGEAQRAIGMRALNQKEITDGAVALVVA